MRILHVIASTNPASGGPIEGIRQLAANLLCQGHEVEVVCCDEPNSPWLGEFSFTVHAVGPGRGGYSYTKGLAPWLMANADRFDAVIADGIWQHTSYTARKVMRKLNKPYFVFTHGMLDPWFKKAYPLKHLKKSLYWPLGEYRVLRDAAAVLFTCEEERTLASQSFRPYKVNERVVNFGTTAPKGDTKQQIESFLNAFPTLRDKPFLLFLSRIHPKKGCDLLIEAFAKVSTREDSTMLCIAGPDQVGLQADLLKLAEDLGIIDRIVWTGMISGDVKWGAYHACDAFILPSHQENFGIVVAEALACSKPVLISNKVNIWREIQNAGAGIVEQDSLEGTISMLTRWNGVCLSERVEMGRRAKTCFDQNFEVTKAAQSILEVLRGSSSG